jgi:hypothetical protein
LIGTLVLPGGLLLPLGFGFLAAVTTEACHTVVGGVQVPQDGRMSIESCTVSPGFWGQALAITILVVTTLAPIVTSFYLAWRARNSSAVGA